MVMFLLLVHIYCRENIRTVIIFLAILLCVFSITGFSPYITNYLIYKSPLGYEFSTETPESYTFKNAGYSNEFLPGWLVPRELFFKSLFSPISQEYTRMKNPFSIDLSELKNLTGENRINGYGPLCGIITILSIILLIIISLNIKTRETSILLICIFFIFLTVILHTSCWWALLVPQFFLIPVLIGFCGYVNGGLISKSISLFLLICLLINLLLVGGFIYGLSYITTHNYNLVLNDISTAHYPVGIISTNTTYYPQANPVTSVLLEERGIPWEICSNSFDCTNNAKQVHFIHFADISYTPNSGVSTDNDTLFQKINNQIMNILNVIRVQHLIT